MVRVIPVHNFSGQSEVRIEEPTVTCTGTIDEQEVFLVALPTHYVQIYRLLSNDLKPIASFPTVDLVKQMTCCDRGNYVATLESKVSADVNGKSIDYARVYLNWMNHDMSEQREIRARIASWVTPCVNGITTETLEMIELPLSASPTAIACCQVTGNLLIAMGSAAIVFAFKVQTQQHSRQKFIDFEARPWYLELDFAPVQLEIVEDFVAARNSSSYHVFRLVSSSYESSQSDQASIASCSESRRSVKTSKSIDSSSTDDSNNCESRSDSGQWSIEWDRASIGTRLLANNRGQDKMDENSNQLIMHFGAREGSHLRQRDSFDEDCQSSSGLQSSLLMSFRRDSEHEVMNPFVFYSADMEVRVKSNLPDFAWTENFTAKSVLRLKTRVTENPDDYEQFTCSTLRPLYSKRESNPHSGRRSIFRSDRVKHLHGVSCLLCTTQDGYFYYFPANQAFNEPNAKCLTSYAFTAPVTHVAMEHATLHALTEVGLETYTLRLSAHVTAQLEQMKRSKIMDPEALEPSTLIGLRVFSGVRCLVHGKSFVVLLCNNDCSWHVNCLKLPRPEELHCDILNAAGNYKSSNPLTYRHLLIESYALARLARNVIRDDAEFERDRDQYYQRMQELYVKSCSLIADYYVSSEMQNEWKLSTVYYKLAGLTPIQVLAREDIKSAAGVVAYLTATLVTMKSGHEADALFQAFNIVEIIATEERGKLLHLILGSGVLREYASEKLINLLMGFELDDLTRLALGILYIQVEKLDRGEAIIKPISEWLMKKTVLRFWHLLFEVTLITKKSHVVLTFSEFSAILMRLKREIFAEILTRIVIRGMLTLHQVIQMFLAYLPSRVGRDSRDAAAALQIFVEMYLKSYFRVRVVEPQVRKIDYDFAMVEAFKILVRSYLGKIMETKDRNEVAITSELKTEPYLFESHRPRYLDLIPPCHFQKFSSETQEIIKEDIPPEFFKLQSLLSSEYLPGICLSEVERFLDSQRIEHGFSLKILCIADVHLGMKMLVDNYPWAVLDYAKV